MRISNLNQLDLNSRYSYADYVEWDLEDRVELIQGKIFQMSPRPDTLHQQTVGEIFRQISNSLHGNSSLVFLAPFDVRLSLIPNAKAEQILTVVQPDICVVSDPSKIDESGCIGAPYLIVEVLSAGHVEKDFNEKFEVYRENGVKEYWLVQPNDRFVLVYLLNEAGKYIGLKPFTGSAVLKSEILPSFQLSVSDIFDL